MTGRTAGPVGGSPRPIGSGGPRDHGGGIDAARARWGGVRGDWLDLSTGINPVPWPEEAGGAPGDGPPDAAHGTWRGVWTAVPREAWTALPDAEASARLVAHARRAWRVPEAAAVLPVPGASAAIAALPRLLPPGRVAIPGPTYNEHAAAFAAAGWALAPPEGPGGPLGGDAAAGVQACDEAPWEARPSRDAGW